MGFSRDDHYNWNCSVLEYKNWCLWTVVLEKTLESPSDCKEIQPVHPEGDQSWVFIGRTDVEPETPILWSPDPKSWLIGKDPDAGKDWGQEEKGMTEDEIVGWHHWLSDGWTPAVGDGQGGLACCGLWGRKESDMTERLNWTESVNMSSFTRYHLAAFKSGYSHLFSQQQWMKFSIHSHPCQHLLLEILSWCYVNISLMCCETEHFFIYFLALGISCSLNCL